MSQYGVKGDNDLVLGQEDSVQTEFPGKLCKSLLSLFLHEHCECVCALS